jgi:hypothetical protein
MTLCPTVICLRVFLFSKKRLPCTAGCCKCGKQKCEALWPGLPCPSVSSVTPHPLARLLVCKGSVQGNSPSLHFSQILFLGNCHLESRIRNPDHRAESQELPLQEEQGRGQGTEL